MISDSANGSNCGVCSEGTLSAELTEAICGFRKHPHLPGSRLPSVSSASRARSTAADRQQILDDIGRADAGQRPLPVVARDRRGDLDDRFGRGELEFAGRGFEAGRRAALPDLGQRRFECARGLGRAIAAQPLPDRQQRRTPDLPGPDRKIALDEKRLERTDTTAAPDRRSADAPRRLPRFRARPCAVARARNWRRRCPRHARWRARTPASAAPATAAGAGRDSPSAARSMSGSCAWCGYACVMWTAKRVRRQS